MKSKYPGLASLAAQLEMFGLSKREMEKKFKRSELAIMAWRSQETAAAFERDTADVKKTAENLKSRKKRKTGGKTIDGLPDHFYNKDGEIDLRQVTGKEAYQFFSKQGIRLPIIAGR